MILAIENKQKPGHIVALAEIMPHLPGTEINEVRGNLTEAFP